MKLTFITYSSAAIQALIQEKRRINTEYPGLIDLVIFYSSAPADAAKKQQLREDILTSDFVFYDQVGVPESLGSEIIGWLEAARGMVIPYGHSPFPLLKLGSIDTLHSKTKIDRNRQPATPAQKQDLENYAAISTYYAYASAANIRNLYSMLLHTYGGIPQLPAPEPPIDLDGVYYCDPGTHRFFEDYPAFVQTFPMEPGKPYIGFICYTSCYPTDTYDVSAAVLQRLRKHFNVIPIAVGNCAEKKYLLEQFLFDKAHPPLELLINVKSFRFSGTPTGGDGAFGVSLLKKLDVAYLKPFYFSKKTEETWRTTMAGCSPSEVLLYMALPEQDGAIETYPIGAQMMMAPDAEYGISLPNIGPIEERLEHLTDRAARHLALRRKPNHEKRVAILCYNYPPGENNMFGGSFLDTFASVEHMLSHLAAEGYDTEAVSKELLMEVFSTGKAVNGSKYGTDWEDMITWDDRAYRGWLSTHDDRDEILELFGPAPGLLMAEDHHFLIPGTVIGKVFVGLQPARCDDGGVQRAYHDKTLPPPHQYIAFYQWLEQVFHADVVIHVGTHGTVELLKGKESGMSGNCYPDLLLGKIPHLYLYFVGNPSEATIAKRRTHAQLVSYQPPVFEAGQLYSDYARLNENIDNLHQAEAISPQLVEETKKKVLEQAAVLNLPENLDDIERELYRMGTSLVPIGLHTIGKGYTDQEAVEYARGLLRLSHAGVPSLRGLVAEAWGEDLEQLEDSGRLARIREIDSAADAIFDGYMASGHYEPAPWMTPQWQEKLDSVLRFAQEKRVSCQENREMECLLRGLRDGYNEARLAGDIFRSPEVLPCGYNMYHMDPRLVPSEVATRRGQAICDNTLRAYLAEKGEYPQSVAVVLWGLETARTQGESFAQILAYLGVRPVRKRGGWSISYEIIPIGELGRPRIDVSVNICGFYRDMFGNLIEDLNDILSRIYDLDETDAQNFYKAHTRKTAQELMESGLDVNDAADLATARMFGPKAGEYGTALHNIVESKSWEKETDLGNIFMHDVQFVYGRSTHGTKAEGLYQRNLRNVDIVSQVRSNPEYEVTDLDHYYEYFGGLSKSVEMVTGKKAKMYISDTTNERVYTEPVEKSIARGVRTRLLNPKWIDGMLEHKIHGAEHIADRFENVTGFAATTGAVEDWVFEEMFSTYVADHDMQARMRENNPHAYMDILERMMELHNRGYWKATEDQLETLRRLYLSLEGDVEDQLG